MAYRPKHRKRLYGFTLVELLVAMAVTVLIATLILGILQSASETWSRNTGRAKTFTAARSAFESISRSVSAATLNTYLDYYDAARNPRPDPSIIDSVTKKSAALNFHPDIYGRQSDLHFVTGNNLVTSQQGGGIFFTAPMDHEIGATVPATGGQLNGIGFFVRFGPDPTLPAFITNNPPRYRLYQFLQPTGELKVMNKTFPLNEWFTSDTDATDPKYCYPLASNVVAFAVLPKLSELEDPAPDSLTSNYSYTSRTAWSGGGQPNTMHQLPPVVRVVMVALDERSAGRLEDGANPPDLGFDPATIFADPANLDNVDDPNNSLNVISAALSGRGLNFRIFQAETPIRAAKWSAN